MVGTDRNFIIADGLAAMVSGAVSDGRAELTWNRKINRKTHVVFAYYNISDNLHELSLMSF